jgi:translation initiation factor IF-2
VSSLRDLSAGDIGINTLHAETGNIGENDVMLAAASKAIVIGFNVQADSAARRLAETEGVSIRLYDIIYRLTEDIEKALKGMLATYEKEIRSSICEVRRFPISKLIICRLPGENGEVRRNSQAGVAGEGNSRGMGKLFEALTGRCARGAAGV